MSSRHKKKIIKKTISTRNNGAEEQEEMDFSQVDKLPRLKTEDYPDFSSVIRWNSKTNSVISTINIAIGSFLAEIPNKIIEEHHAQLYYNQRNHEPNCDLYHFHDDKYIDTRGLDKDQFPLLKMNRSIGKSKSNVELRYYKRYNSLWFVSSCDIAKGSELCIQPFELIVNDKKRKRDQESMVPFKKRRQKTKKQKTIEEEEETEIINTKMQASDILLEIYSTSVEEEEEEVSPPIVSSRDIIEIEDDDDDYILLEQKRHEKHQQELLKEKEEQELLKEKKRKEREEQEFMELLFEDNQRKVAAAEKIEKERQLMKEREKIKLKEAAQYFPRVVSHGPNYEEEKQDNQQSEAIDPIKDVHFNERHLSSAAKLLNINRDILKNVLETRTPISKDVHFNQGHLSSAAKLLDIDQDILNNILDVNIVSKTLQAPPFFAEEIQFDYKMLQDFISSTNPSCSKKKRNELFDFLFKFNKWFIETNPGKSMRMVRKPMELCSGGTECNISCSLQKQNQIQFDKEHFDKYITWFPMKRDCLRNIITNAELETLIVDIEGEDRKEHWFSIDLDNEFVSGRITLCLKLKRLMDFKQWKSSLDKQKFLKEIEIFLKNVWLFLPFLLSIEDDDDDNGLHHEFGGWSNELFFVQHQMESLEARLLEYKKGLSPNNAWVFSPKLFSNIFENHKATLNPRVTGFERKASVHLNANIEKTLVLDFNYKEDSTDRVIEFKPNSWKLLNDYLKNVVRWFFPFHLQLDKSYSIYGGDSVEINDMSLTFESEFIELSNKIKQAASGDNNGSMSTEGKIKMFTL
jgi:hypothetical protein